jgi:CDGSH-type Zn-finger protein
MSDQPVVAQRAPYVCEEQPGKKFWCACGRSKNQPYCDGSHKGRGFSPIAVEITEAETVAWCGCKQSGKKPHCDGSHTRA